MNNPSFQLQPVLLAEVDQVVPLLKDSEEG
jgi:hypothetical protein